MSVDPLHDLLTDQRYAKPHQMALQFAWEQAPYIRQGKYKKWVGTGEDAGKKARYQHDMPGVRKRMKEAAEKSTHAEAKAKALEVLAKHAVAEASEYIRGQAAKTLALLKRHHGENAVHRIRELAEMDAEQLWKATSERERTHLEARLLTYREMLANNDEPATTRLGGTAAREEYDRIKADIRNVSWEEIDAAAERWATLPLAGLSQTLTAMGFSAPRTKQEAVGQLRETLKSIKISMHQVDQIGHEHTPAEGKPADDKGEAKKEENPPTPVDNPSEPATIVAGGAGGSAPEKREGETMTPTTKWPWEMTPSEYQAAYAAVPKRDGGYPDYARLKELGMGGNWGQDLRAAVSRGEPVPQAIIDMDAQAVATQAEVRLKANLGEDYTAQVKAKAAAPVHEVLGRDGDSITVRQRQMPGGSFHEHKKGDVVTMPDGSLKIVAKAKKPGKLRGDGGVWAYTQEIALRDPKETEQDDATQARWAAEALVHDGAPNNRDYADLKKKQMAEHAARAYLAFGKPIPPDVMALLPENSSARAAT